MLKPLYITAALALGLAGGAAFAQTARVSTAGTTASTAASPSTTGTTSTTGTSAAAVGGCSGSNGSSCSASNSNSGTTTGTATTTGSTLDTNTVQAPTSSGTSMTSGNPTSRPLLENSTNVDPALTRPEPFAPGGTFGAAPVPPVAETGGVTPGSGIVMPEGTQAGTQQNVFVQPQTRPSVTVLNTPLFDQAAREGRAKEARRRATGNEPRVYGLAPRTDRDLTWQMPDDPIIRY